MRIHIDELDGLWRRLEFAIPAQRIYEAVWQRLTALARTVKLDGFRQGKAPLAVVERQFGQEIRQEVIGELLVEVFQEITEQAHLRPASVPDIAWKSPEATLPDEPEFSAVFEVYPEFSLVPVTTLRLERPVVAITAADVTRMLDAMRRLHLEWVAVARPAEHGDRVLVDIQGYMDDEALREIRRIPFVLGEPVMGGAFGKAVQNEFARQLLGAAPGDYLELEIGFPEAYEKPHLAGATMHFTLHICSVEAPNLPELNDDFAKKLKHPGGLAALWAETQASMTREAEEACWHLVRQRVKAALLAAHDFPLPHAQVAREAEKLLAQVRTRMLADGFTDADVEIASFLVEDRARRQVAWQLILQKLVAEQGLESDPAQVRRIVADIAAEYGQAAQVDAWYREHPDAAAELEIAALEERVVNWVLARAEVVEVPVAFTELMRQVTDS